MKRMTEYRWQDAVTQSPEATVSLWETSALGLTDEEATRRLERDGANRIAQQVTRWWVLYDVGVAGIHRVLDKKHILERANVLIVIAGMEGALASVVSGLVSRPVIAVPTSVGYGASFEGIAPLLTMMNSCSPGVAVMNIDNGFGAAYFASMINN